MTCGWVCGYIKRREIFREEKKVVQRDPEKDRQIYREVDFNLEGGAGCM